ncbi:MAG: outer membrane beta-barrel protein, partial [bacterium]|nr:outer membrane beta-barrel protein [bacterium]
IFAKAGVNYSAIKASTEFSGATFSSSSTDFGVGGGAGFEYFFNDRIGLTVGATVKLLFSGEDGTGTWFKFYGGVSYRLK